MSISGYRFFKIWMPLHLHFTTSFDALKYNSKSKSINIDIFNERKDKHLFEAYGSRFDSDKDCFNFCLANFVYNQDSWLYYAYEEAKEQYEMWARINIPLYKTITHDYNVLAETLASKKAKAKSLFVKTPKGNVPPLIQLVSSGSVSKEFLCLVDCHILPIFSKWSNTYNNDPLIVSEMQKLMKYEGFVKHKVEVKSFQSTFKELVKNHG